MDASHCVAFSSSSMCYLASSEVISSGQLTIELPTLSVVSAAAVSCAMVEQARTGVLQKETVRLTSSSLSLSSSYTTCTAFRRLEWCSYYRRSTSLES